MIAGIIHSGSGLGNQLFRYVATRVLALDKGYEFSMVAPENFKGKSFMNLDMGWANKENTQIHFETIYPEGRVVPKFAYDDWKENTPYYNPEFNFIEDNTIIDGEFQDERYFQHRIDDINEWLMVEPIDIPNDTCVIGFRGGEFYVFPELGLPKSYFDEGIEIMKAKGIKNFEVHTDDPKLAKEFFPDYPVIHDIGINWRSMRYARHAIIANSSFYILPRLLRHSQDYFGDSQYFNLTIAPRYWARRNTGEWSMPQNYYKRFKYI